tara:strand:+ start:873 stop:1055 length:183 start_codon:yes stop_codon:yes gene_type:complete
MEKLRFNANKRETNTIDFNSIKKRPESSLNHCDWHDMRLVIVNDNLECPKCLEAIKELYS